MDSFIHRLSSNRWPITIQAQRRATNKLMEATEAWSEVDTISKFANTGFNKEAIVNLYWVSKITTQPNICNDDQCAIPALENLLSSEGVQDILIRIASFESLQKAPIKPILQPNKNY